jgi:uncharacterized OB-fold protein
MDSVNDSTWPAVFAGPGPQALYFQKLGEGVFEIQRCEHCARHFFYPRVTCRYCGSAAVKWIQPSGIGTVYSTTIVRRKPDDGGDYNVAIVELAEGPRMMTRISDIAPAEVRIGARVKARVDGAGRDSVLVFVPFEDGQEARHG